MTIMYNQEINEPRALEDIFKKKGSFCEQFEQTQTLGFIRKFCVFFFLTFGIIIFSKYAFFFVQFCMKRRLQIRVKKCCVSKTKLHKSFANWRPSRSVAVKDVAYALFVNK